MTVNSLMRALCDELLTGDVPAPLAQEFTLAMVWDDLARLAGEPVPGEVSALIAGAVHAHARSGRLIDDRPGAPDQE